MHVTNDETWQSREANREMNPLGQVQNLSTLWQLLQNAENLGERGFGYENVLISEAANEKPHKNGSKARLP